MQLHALLSSMQANCSLFDRVCVVFTASAEHQRAYELLRTEFDSVEFIQEKNFEVDVKSNMKREYEYTCFFVDDIICYRSVEHLDVGTLLPGPDDVCYSLRLGLGHVNSPGAPRRFDWTKQIKNFAYPLSTDGHIFHTSFITSITDQIRFINPNKLESGWQRFKKNCRSHMLYGEHSYIVSIPVNRVSATASASFGEKFPYTAEELNRRYLSGERIDWKNMDFSAIVDCHQELEFVFKNVNERT